MGDAFEPLLNDWCLHCLFENDVEFQRKHLSHANLFDFYFSLCHHNDEEIPLFLSLIASISVETVN